MRHEWICFDRGPVLLQDHRERRCEVKGICFPTLIAADMRKAY